MTHDGTTSCDESMTGEALKIVLVWNMLILLVIMFYRNEDFSWHHLAN